MAKEVDVSQDGLDDGPIRGYQAKLRRLRLHLD